MRRNRLTKIVATIGPASSKPQVLRQLHDAGVDVFRLNFSHGSHEDHAAVIAALRAMERELAMPICILADLQGPKLRVGTVPDGEMMLRWGEEVRVLVGDGACAPGLLQAPHPELYAAAEVGDALLIDDGKVRLSVIAKDAEGLTAKVEAPGPIKTRKGVTLIGRPLPIPALTEKDRGDLMFALAQDVDWVALSFVQRVEDVTQTKDLIAGRAGLVSKIEKPSAIADMDAIIEASDAVMVARGDLGVELPMERVPIEQRRLVRACRKAGKPVIVATQMLESMIDQATPTRAEASDVAGAVYAGADAVMLSAETAVGRHPPTAAAVMDRIIAAVEQDPDYWERLERPPAPDISVTASAIASAAGAVAAALPCQAVVAYSRTGATSLRVARERPPCPILALSPDPRVARRLTLVWGLMPSVSEDVGSFDVMVRRAENAAREAGLSADDRVVIIAGAPFGQPGKTNTLKVSRVGEA